MTFDQLKAFVAAPDHVRQIALTKAAARQLIAEHERELGKPERGFEIDTKRADAGGYRAMENARIDRMLFDDAQRKAGLREGVS